MSCFHVWCGFDGRHCGECAPKPVASSKTLRQVMQSGDPYWPGGEVEQKAWFAGYDARVAETEISQHSDDADRANGVGQDELVSGLKRALQHPDGDHDGWTDAGMEHAFFRWPVIVNALNIVLASPTPPADEQHPDDRAVNLFAAKMKTKLAMAREKGRGGWDDPAQCSTTYLSQLLHEHVSKGDPLDVANFCMMIEHYGAAIDTPPADASAQVGAATWANTSEELHERILLLSEVELHLKSCRIFLTTREKMHPVGVDIHDELLGKVTAAINAIGRENGRG